MPLSRRLPKRGFHNRARKQFEVVNTGRLVVFEAGATVDADALARRGLIRGAGRPVKLLGEGDAPRDLTVRVHRISSAARSKVEAAGGRVEILA
jgi:large subunit ribosomal protein L15